MTLRDIMPDWLYFFLFPKPLTPAPVEISPRLRALVAYPDGPPETNAEAKALLEKEHYCLKHLTKNACRYWQHWPGEKPLPPTYTCKECVEEERAEFEYQRRLRERREAKAVAILKGELAARPEKVSNSVGLPYCPDSATIQSVTENNTEEIQDL